MKSLTHQPGKVVVGLCHLQTVQQLVFVGQNIKVSYKVAQRTFRLEAYPH